ncbi:2-octaprenyl-3-methyl-6-methoxy-12C4-benzoquinol hydroxylase [gamma proteobacterium IMCC2047]|nr:2-octaprenyl-3-methyl-6-methoxy-12C4-benzoquinol hydroxylase [gamma proteobacterium IMCC2047]
MNYDVIIIGAGPAGQSLACRLNDAGLKVALLEKQSETAIAAPQYDGREIALTHLSVKILNKLDVWKNGMQQHATEMLGARVIDGTSDHTLAFERPDQQLDALGYMIANQWIRQHLFERTKTLTNVELICGQSVSDVRTNKEQGIVCLEDGRVLTAPLVIAADSRFSQIRRMMGISAEMNDFARVAIVCRMKHEKPHQQLAWECFHYGRTLAILPLSDNECSAVITLPADQAAAVQEMSETEFSADVQRRFGSRLGNMELISERYAYPLVGVHAKRFVTQRFALLGDAAVGMHPVTAHGFNLGLRGSDTLARGIIKAHEEKKDIGSNRVLNAYQREHMLITRPLYHGTNGIVGLFTNDKLPAKLARKAVLHISNRLPPLKRSISAMLTETHPRKLLPF